MALDLKILPVPISEDWLLYDATGKNAIISNRTTTVINYAFEDNPTEWFSLSDDKPIKDVVNQPIYFKVFDKRELARLDILTGIPLSTFSPASEKIPGSVVLADANGNQATITPFGKLAVTIEKKEIGIKFNKPLNPQEVTTEGTPIAMFNGTVLRVQTGDTIRTNKAIVYEAGDGIKIDFTAEFSSFGAVGDISEIGWIDDYQGVAIKATDGKLKVFYRNIFADCGIGTVGTAPDVEFEIDEPLIDINKMYRFQIILGHLGIGNIAVSFKPFGSKEPYKILHVFETDGALTQRTHVGNPSIEIRAKVVGATAGTIYSGSWSGATYSSGDSIQNLPEEVRIEKIVSVNAGQMLPIAAFRNKNMFAGFPNKTRSRLEEIIVTTNSEGWYVIELWTFSQGVISGGTWIPVNNMTSVLEYNEGISFVPLPGEKALVTIDVLVPSQGTGVGETSKSIKDRRLNLDPDVETVITKRCITQGGGNDDTALKILHTNLF